MRSHSRNGTRRRKPQRTRRPNAASPRAQPRDTARGVGAVTPDPSGAVAPPVPTSKTKGSFSAATTDPERAALPPNSARAVRNPRASRAQAQATNGQRHTHTPAPSADCARTPRPPHNSPNRPPRNSIRSPSNTHHPPVPPLEGRVTQQGRQGEERNQESSEEQHGVSIPSLRGLGVNLGSRCTEPDCRPGAPARIRTWDRRIRSPVLYPAELRAPCGPG